MSICFVSTIYKEFDLASRLLDSIRLHYPKEQIIFITDGTSDQAFLAKCEEMNAEYIEGERLKTFGKKGLWRQRSFFQFVKTRKDIMISIDPDAILHRPFSFFPEEDIFGTIRKSYHLDFPIIAGPCSGYQRDAVLKILRSELLIDSYLDSIVFSYDRYGQYKLTGEEKENDLLVYVDMIIGWIAAELRLSLASWSDINIQWREIVDNPNNRWAVTHEFRR